MKRRWDVLLVWPGDASSSRQHSNGFSIPLKAAGWFGWGKSMANTPTPAADPQKNDPLKVSGLWSRCPGVTLFGVTTVCAIGLLVRLLKLKAICLACFWQSDCP